MWRVNYEVTLKTREHREKGVSKFLISASIVNDGDRDQLCSRVLGSLSQSVRDNSNGSLGALSMRHGKISCDGSAFRTIREKPCQ